LLLPSILVVFSEVSSILNAFKTVDGFSQRFADAYNTDADEFSSLPRLLGSEISIFKKSPSVQAQIDSGPLNIDTAHTLVFKDATFAFNPLDPPIIDNTSFFVKRGSLTSIIGPSGSGKSVLVKIILGLYSLQSGGIYFDGDLLDSNTIQCIREKIAYIPQEPFIYSGTVTENLLHGAFNASAEDILELSKATGFYEIVNMHPQGFNRVLNDGGTDLSGGQRQLLQLTRALLRKPQLLLLDEGTSALDNVTEAKIVSLLKKREITTLSISHRKTLIDSSTDILTFANRSITRSGH
jgi:ATP-binding cassette subfamily B protein